MTKGCKFCGGKLEQIDIKRTRKGNFLDLGDTITETKTFKCKNKLCNRTIQIISKYNENCGCISERRIINIKEISGGILK